MKILFQLSFLAFGVSAAVQPRDVAVVKNLMQAAAADWTAIDAAITGLATQLDNTYHFLQDGTYTIEAQGEMTREEGFQVFDEANKLKNRILSTADNFIAHHNEIIASPQCAAIITNLQLAYMWQTLFYGIAGKKTPTEATQMQNLSSVVQDKLKTAWSVKYN